MKLIRYTSTGFVFMLILFSGCTTQTEKQKEAIVSINQDLLSNYVEVTLNTDLNFLSDGEKKIILLLIEASEIIDDIFWTQSIGN